MQAKVIWDVVRELGGNPEGGPKTYLYRARVPGGWLIKFVVVTGAAPDADLAFIPDPGYTWDSWE